MYKAIFLDLDGTLLDDEKNISAENKQAIKDAREKGVEVILCSGRQQQKVKEFREMAGASNYIISSNGSEIMDCDTNEILFSSNLDIDFCRGLYEYALQNNFICRLDTKYGRYTNNMKYEYAGEIEILDKERFFYENDIVQFTIGSTNNEDVDTIIDFLDQLQRKDIKVENRYRTPTKGGEVWSINIIRKSASKGNAIYGLCKFLRFDLEEVIAMGDDLNDISMMETVGLGIAMGNAMQQVKDAAVEVTKKNTENGVAEVINNKIL